MAKNDAAPKDVSKKGDGTVTVRLVKGLRGTQARHRLSVKALGLGKLNSVRVLKDSPQVRGLINQLHYLVKVEE
ncbi:MAG: 50S ribosomal protein L30 [Thermomonas sp.]